jgi:prolyl oligopeptidase
MPMSGSDRYQWLEEVEGERALEWVRAQNARSLAALEADARFPALAEEALKIANNPDRLAIGAIRGGMVYNFWQDETQVRGVWRRASLESYRKGAPAWETLLDVDALAKAEDKNWVFKGANCLEPGGALCMIALSNGGLDAVEWREFDVAAKRFVGDGFVLPAAKSSLAWENRDTLLAATDWGPDTLTESGYPFVVKRWKRGEPLTAAVEVLRGQPKDVGVFLSAFTDMDGTTTPIAVEAETFFSFSNWRIGAGGGEKLTLPPKASIQAVHKGELVFTLEQDWTPPGAAAGFRQGALLSMPLKRAAETAPPVRLLTGPGERQSIDQVGATKEAVIAAAYDNVRGRLLRFTFDGNAWVETQSPLPDDGAMTIATASSEAPIGFVIYEDFLRPETLFEVDARTGRAAEVAAVSADFDASPFVTDQFEATSRDGTKIPYFVVRRKDMVANGENATLLYGYGGFQISMKPSYSGFNGKLWLERGGVYVVANIRGGGEFGPAWHQAGLKLNRQVIYDDFIAVAEDLIARKITSPRRLGIMGGSNGGLLMGVMLTQRPELFQAAVVQVPLLDMLRYHLLLAGASWVDEYGDPNVPEERRFLADLSPYHNLRRRPDFPTPFFVTSTKDDRVHPAHARKFAARMEALDMPFFYYENVDGGHSAAANLKETAKRRALETVYLMKRLMD